MRDASPSSNLIQFKKDMERERYRFQSQAGGIEAPHYLDCALRHPGELDTALEERSKRKAIEPEILKNDAA